MRPDNLIQGVSAIDGINAAKHDGRLTGPGGRRSDRSDEVRRAAEWHPGSVVPVAEVLGDQEAPADACCAKPGALPGTLRLDLPWPPSVNRYWRNVGDRVLICRAGREYRDAVQSVVWHRALTIDTPRWPPDAWLAVTIYAAPPDRRRRDLDNLLKATLDSLTHAGVWDDDRQAAPLLIDWEMDDHQNIVVVRGGRLRVLISQRAGVWAAIAWRASA